MTDYEKHLEEIAYRAHLRANEDAKNKRSEEAVKLLTIAVGVPLVIYIIAAMFT